MEIITPKYYKSFNCIASRCSHSCCVGWDIEIDGDTLERYKGDTAYKKIVQSICEDDGCAYFKADKDGRCPFLNKSGLCDIITEFGEGALCQICADHPRFRNFYSGAVEVGLGLCCEEAARIILKQTDSFCLPVPKNCDSEEQSFFKLRNNVFAILQDREFDFDERLENLLDFFGITLEDYSAARYREFFKALEILDPDWLSLLDKMTDESPDKKWDTVFEQLACYFIFRHLSDALYDGLYIERIGFTVISCRVIRAICAGTNALDFEKIADICRAFSAEIEYSDENPQKIFDMIK